MRAHNTIGIDVGGTKARVGVVDPDGGVVWEAYHQLEVRDTDELIALLTRAAHEARSNVGGRVQAIGVGVPSLVDPATGIAVTTVHLPLTNVPIRDLLSERLGLPVCVDNDATGAMAAEHLRGAARGADTAALLTIGTGIGGGIVTHGRLMRGASGGAGEWGHTTVELNGPPCHGGCGNRGCLETLVSGPGLARAAKAHIMSHPDTSFAHAAAQQDAWDGAFVTRMAMEGDPDARAVVEGVGHLLGVGLVNIVNVLNPEVIVLGGGVMANGEMLLEPARRVVRERARTPSRDAVQIVPTRFGERAGMVGMAFLAGQLTTS